jgi:hypothetical protein
MGADTGVETGDVTGVADETGFTVLTVLPAAL